MTSALAQIRTLLIDDHAVFRECVAHVLSMEDDFTVQHCGSIAAGMGVLMNSQVDVVLLDHDLGAERASQFLPAARQAGFEGRVLIVTAWISDTEVRRLLRQGVSGVFFKERPLSDLAVSIRAVASGRISLDPRYEAMAASAVRSVGKDSARKFNERQRRVLRLVMEGLSNKEIGWRLKISESYVKAIPQRLFQKTGVRTRGQLVRIALEQYREQLLEEPAEPAPIDDTLSRA
jgi:two-component system nitrate/nitrite response regulator NarL